jgi:hypothetical protein
MCSQWSILYLEHRALGWVLGLEEVGEGPVNKHVLVYNAADRADDEDSLHPKSAMGQKGEGNAIYASGSLVKTVTCQLD